MKTAFNIILLVVLVMHGLSCSWFTESEDTKPEIDKLPLETTSGLQTFGCLVNEKAFVPYSKGQIAGVFQLGILQINGKVDDPTDPNVPLQHITLTLIEDADHFIDLGTYQLTNPPYRDAKCSINDCYYYEEHISSGWVTITRFDRVNYIISGTFEFTAEGNGCEKVNVTNGRFDLKYVP